MGRSNEPYYQNAFQELTQNQKARIRDARIKEIAVYQILGDHTMLRAVGCNHCYMEIKLDLKGQLLKNYGVIVIDKNSERFYIKKKKCELKNAQLIHKENAPSGLNFKRITQIARQKYGQYKLIQNNCYDYIRKILQSISSISEKFYSKLSWAQFKNEYFGIIKNFKAKYKTEKIRLIWQFLIRAGPQTIVDLFNPSKMAQVSSLNIGLSVFANFFLQAQQYNRNLPDQQKFHKISSFWPFIKKFFYDDGAFDRIITIVCGTAGNLIGNIAGVWAGAKVGAAMGAKIGVWAGVWAGPVLATCTTVVGTFIGAVIGASIGTTIGRKIARPIAKTISKASKAVCSWFSSWFN